MSGIGHSDTDFHDFYDFLVVRHDFFMIFQGFHRNGIIFGHILQSSFFLVSPVIRFLQLLRLNSQWFVEWTRSCSENQLKSMESVVPSTGVTLIGGVTLIIYFNSMDNGCICRPIGKL